MKTMNQLIAEIGAQNTEVTHVEIISTEFGEILRVYLQPMQHPHILRMQIDLPTEVVDQYDFQDAGAAWKAGWSKLTDHLKNK